MIRALILLILAACTTSKSAEQHAEVAQETRATAHAEEQSAASGRIAAGPETITTTVEEFETASNQPPLDPATVGHEAAGVRNTGKGPAQAPPILLRRSVTVDQRGPVDSSWMASASGTHGAEQDISLQAHVEAQSASKTSYWPPWPILLGAALALAAALWLARGKLKLALEAVRALVG